MPLVRRWATLLPLGLALAAFAPGLGGGFVRDDWPAIVQNPAVNGDLPLTSLLSRSFWGLPLDVPPPTWRPLASLSFRLDYWLFGISPVAFHLASLAYYLLLIHLVHRLARRLLGSGPALWATCLYAVLPVHAENVSSLVGRADTLALAGCVVALLCLLPLKPGQPIDWKAQAAAALALLAALLCKESSAVLPGLAAVLLLACPGAEVPRWRALLPVLPLVLVVAGYLALRLFLLPATFDASFVLDDVTRGASFGSRISYSLELGARYIRLLIAPVDLCVGRKYAILSAPDGLSLRAALGAALLLAVAWASTRDLRRRRPMLWLCAALAWLPFSSLLFVVPEAMADRFLLAPSLFLCFAVAGPMCAWMASSRIRVWLASAFLVAQAMLSAFYATRWHDDLTLFRHAVAACPDSLHNQVVLAQLLSQNRQPADASWHFALALDARRSFPNPWHHPALDAELSLPADARLRQLPELLHVANDARGYYDYFIAYLELQRAPDEANLMRQMRARRWPEEQPRPSPQPAER
jgi:hypothetical protein